MGELGSYRRMDAEYTPTSPAWAVAVNEARLAWRNQWSRLAFIGVMAFTVMYLGSLYTLGERGNGGNTWENFLQFAGNLRWGALAVAAIMAGPGLLEDRRQGALELYLSRPMRQRSYLLAKALTALVVVSATLFVPIMFYFGASYVIFEDQPGGWAWLPLRGLGYVLLWSVPITGVGFGLSCLAKSGRAAAMFLFGGVFALDAVVTNLLSGITRTSAMKLLSPLAIHQQQTEWLFGQSAPYEFAAWLGLVVLLGLAVVGWGFMALRFPRLQGGES